MPVRATALALLLGLGCAGIRVEEIETRRPLPAESCLAVGFLGGRDAWDDETKGVRQLALDLRRRGVFAETFENRSRDVALGLVQEARASRLVVYGQSFGGAAVVRFAREAEIEVELTLQIDSVGRNDAVLPPNVRNAANFYQTDGWFLDGEHPIRAANPERTRILGNWRFDYSKPPGSEISIADVPWWKLAFRIPHARMDRDPEVWRLARRFLEAACAGEDLENITSMPPEPGTSPSRRDAPSRVPRSGPGARPMRRDRTPGPVLRRYR
jgi:hypothetical protein